MLDAIFEQFLSVKERIKNFQRTRRQQRNVEKSFDGAATRGTLLHLSAAIYLLSPPNERPSAVSSEDPAWPMVKAVLDKWLQDGWQPFRIECPLFSPTRPIGGRLDWLLRKPIPSPSSGTLALALFAFLC